MSVDVPPPGSGSGDQAGPAPGSDAGEQAAARARAWTLRWALGAVAVVLAVGGVLAWNALNGDGTGTVVVTAEDPAPEGATPQASGEIDPTVGGATSAGTPDSGSIAGTGTDEQSTGSEEDEPGQPQASTTEAQEPEALTTEAQAPEAQEPEAQTPEELSTGPALVWTEIDPGIERLSILQSVGDGRVLARALPFGGQVFGGFGFDGGEQASGGEQVDLTAQILVSSNGIDWTEVPMPEGVSPDQVDISGDRWLVAGPDTDSESFAYGPLGLPSIRAFFSDDEGTTWTELDISVSADPTPSSPWLVEQSAVASALVSGERIVLVVQSYTTLDAHALLSDRGLLPEGKTAAYWLATPGDRLEITLFDAPDPDDPSAPPMPGGEQILEVSIEELGLTDEEEAALDRFESGRVSVLWSDGSTVELAAEYDSLGALGVSTGSGFELMIFAEQDLLVLTSGDGLVWSEDQSSWDQYSGRSVVADGTIWRTVSDPFGGFSVQRGDDGQPPATVATFEGLAPAGDLTAGPAGVAVPVFQLNTDGSAGSGVVLPEGRVAKDGYELRYNEPEGGITLWDLAADAPVYEFGPEAVGAATTPDGVREIHDDGTFAVVFEDPDTGADLVTFTEDDLNPILESGLSEGDGTYEPPEVWVGWSADGTNWGWQTLADAFGTDESESESWAHFAVGRDFVIAQVQVFPRFEPSETADGQSGTLMASGGEAQPPRWFIAQVP